MANTGFPAVVGLSDGHQMALTHENIFLPKSIPVPVSPSTGNLINREWHYRPVSRAANQATPEIPGYRAEIARKGERMFPSRENLIRQERAHRIFTQGALQAPLDESEYIKHGEAMYQFHKKQHAAARNFQTARVTNQMDFPWREYEPANRENLKRRFPEKRRAANA